MAAEFYIIQAVVAHANACDKLLYQLERQDVSGTKLSPETDNSSTEAEKVADTLETGQKDNPM